MQPLTQRGIACADNVGSSPLRDSDAIQCTYAAPSISAWVAVAEAVALPKLREYYSSLTLSHTCYNPH